MRTWPLHSWLKNQTVVTAWRTFLGTWYGAVERWGRATQEVSIRGRAKRQLQEQTCGRWYTAYHQKRQIGTTTASCKIVKMAWGTITRAGCNWQSFALFQGGLRWDENRAVLHFHTVVHVSNTLASLGFYRQKLTQPECCGKCMWQFVRID